MSIKKDDNVNKGNSTLCLVGCIDNLQVVHETNSIRETIHTLQVQILAKI